VSTPPSASPLHAAPTVTGFTLRALGLLPFAFVVWYFAAPVLLFPVVLLLRGIAHVGFSGLVASIEQSAAIATFVTSLRISGATTRGVLTVDVNLLLYAFGMPLYAALTLASRSKSWRRNLALGYVVLAPCVAFGAFADFLKNVAITAAPAITAQTGFAAWQREAIAFAFQLGSLILPAVAPAVLWVALNQRLIAVLRRGGESVSSA